MPIREAQTSGLSLVPCAARDAMLAGERDAARHAQLQSELPAFHEVEVREAPRGSASSRAPRAARVVAWNAQRGGAPNEAAAWLRPLRPGALLLSELDVGMARTGQIHAMRALAERLEMGFAYAVEYLELGLGDAHEQARCAGLANDVGYHGAAVASAHALERPALARLGAGGEWFDGRRGEARVGGRVAVLATLRLAGGPVTLVSVHLESHGDPLQREEEVAALLDALDIYAPGAPALLGGDFNTHSLGVAELADRAALERAARADPQRFARPQKYEPLFARLERAGFEWAPCNRMEEPTHWIGARRPERRGGLCLDWFFARGLELSDPQVVPALDESGAALSDHDAIAVTIALPGPGAR